MLYCYIMAPLGAFSWLWSVHADPRSAPASSPSCRRDPSSGRARALDPALGADRAADRGGGHGCGDLGRRVLGDGVMDRVMTAAALRFCNLTLGYDRHPAVHHLDGVVASGALMAVVGPNGAGKSTLFKGIAGLLRPLAGTIERGGLGVQDIAYLPQAAEIDKSFPINLFDMVAMGLWRHAGLFGSVGRQARSRIEQAIAAVGLTGFEDRAIGTLSGGQMQRMLFARLLLQDARVIVLDEPFNAVDAKTSADLFDLIKRWHGEARTVITAMHDIDFVRLNFPETLLLAREPVAWGRTASVLTPENLLAARRMCEAFDQQAGPCVDEEAPALQPSGEVAGLPHPRR